MDTTLTIRMARRHDAAELRDLFQDTVLTVNSQDYTQEEIEDWASCGNDLSHIDDMINSHHFIVALNRKSILVGFSSITPGGYLHNMFVHRKYQRMGVATALLNEIERYARDTDIKTITTEVSLTARAFFENKGFAVEKRQKRKANRLFLTNFVMTKKIV